MVFKLRIVKYWEKNLHLAVKMSSEKASSWLGKRCDLTNFFLFLAIFPFFCREQIIYWIWLTEFIRITRTVGGCSVSWEPTDFKEVKSVQKKDLIFKINFIEINKTTLDYNYSWILNEGFCWNSFILIFKSIKYNIRIWIEMSY